ncbi:MAG TPA: FecR domain-containing protein [Rhizomicrobium sp.]|nr:FecR domain-containing protein [Rhizomicrobium sp.]
MTDELAALVPATESAAVQLAASRWVVSRQDGEHWTADDQAEFDTWLNASVANRISFLRAEQAWARTSRAAALKRPMREPAPQPHSNQLPGAKFVAAIAAALLLGAGAFSYFSQPNYTPYETPVGGRQILTLSDGSQIELNTNSKVRIASAQNARRVIVDKGDVYFDVRHDARRPFVVVAHGRTLVDLGTKFLVRERPDALEVSLLEGKLKLEAPKGGNTPATIMAPGEVALATERTTSVTRTEHAAITTELSWRQGILIFHHTPLSEAVAEFNRYTTRKIAIANPLVARLEINGKFRTNDVAMFADVTADVLGLKADKRDDRIVIGR